MQSRPAGQLIKEKTVRLWKQASAVEESAPDVSPGVRLSQQVHLLAISTGEDWSTVCAVEK